MVLQKNVHPDRTGILLLNVAGTPVAGIPVAGIPVAGIPVGGN